MHDLDLSTDDLNPAGKGAAFQVSEPGSGKILANLRQADASETGIVAEKARAAQESWFNLPYEQRATILRTAADLLEANAEMYAGWIIRETGSVAAKAHFEVSLTIKVIREAAAMPSQPHGLVLPSTPGKLSFCRRMPLGVVAVISPFNFPMYLGMRAVAPALAVGNAVVLKPDPRTSIVGGLLMTRLFQAAGLPEDVLSTVIGGADAGEALCSSEHIAMVQFTGSTAVGRKIGGLAGSNLKKVSLELGGKNSLLILDDADLDLAASNAAWGAWLHQGQICMSSGRILVHESIHDQLAARLKQKAEVLPVGDPASGQQALGPIIDKAQAERVIGIVENTVAAGASIAAGGDANGHYVKPTVLTGVTRDMRAFREELFGPVAVLIPFSTDEEAVELANDTEYGLSAGIISKSVGRALAIGAKLRTGLLHINDQTVADEVVNPFGGRGKSGNGTSIGGPANWDEFSQWQWVTIQDQAPASPF